MMLPALAVALLLQDPAPQTAPAAPSPPAPALLTSLWADQPDDPARVRIDPLPGIPEPSDLLLSGGRLYTISDSHQYVYRLSFEKPDAPPARDGTEAPSKLPSKTDLEALAPLPTGEVLMSNESDGSVFVMSPFPKEICATWKTGVEGGCFLGRPNCGLEAIAVLPEGRLFAAKERDTRAAWSFDLPANPCEDAALGGRTYLALPEEAGPDISAAVYHQASGHLLVVARSQQMVLELAVPPATPGDTSPRPLALLGSFSYARTEDSLRYTGPRYKQVEGIAVDDQGVLYLVIDPNGRFSGRFASGHAALLRFYPSR